MGFKIGDKVKLVNWPDKTGIIKFIYNRTGYQYYIESVKGIPMLQANENEIELLNV
jgi:hypothetical protein